MPPSVARLADDGSAPKVRPCSAAAGQFGQHQAGLHDAVRATGSRSTIRFTCREASITTPPIALPAIDVPPPRIVTGAPAAAVSSTAAASSSTSAGRRPGRAPSGSSSRPRVQRRLRRSSPTVPRSAVRSSAASRSTSYPLNSEQLQRLALSTIYLSRGIRDSREDG